MKKPDAKPTPADAGGTSEKNNPPKQLPTTDFDILLPWICMQRCCSKTVTVIKEFPESTIRAPRLSSTAKASLRSKRESEEPKGDDENKTVTSLIPSAKSVDRGPCVVPDNECDNVKIRAYYDTENKLVEVAFIKTQEIPIKILQALSLCIPFQPELAKITFQSSGLTALLLHEITKILSQSNLTDICIVDCCIPECNFYILLDQVSQIKYLTLNRCCINDEACIEIASRLKFGKPGCSLLILNLAINSITDVGAQCIGEILRTNRSLLHLNLSGNKITDTGADAILNSLAEFALTYDEVFTGRAIMYKYLRDKINIYQQCLEEVEKEQRFEQLTPSKNVAKKPGNKKTQTQTEKSTAEMAEDMTISIIGDYLSHNPFPDIVKRENRVYAIGNMTLCSINLAGNNISYLTIKKMYEVLKYQNSLGKLPGKTGLMRVVVEGNDIPTICAEYGNIQDYLGRKIYENTEPIIKTSKSTKRSSRILIK